LSEHDLQAMYGTGTKESLLWYDGRSQETGRRNRKKTNDDEEDIDEEVPSGSSWEQAYKIYKC